jgi:hypothetical protein
VSATLDDAHTAAHAQITATTSFQLQTRFISIPVTNVPQVGGGLVYCGVADSCGYVIAQQIVGVVVCVAWAVSNSAVTIWILGRLQLMRVDLSDEMAGLDSTVHGGSVNMSAIPDASTSAMPVFSFAVDQQPALQSQAVPGQDLLGQLQRLQQQFNISTQQTFPQQQQQQQLSVPSHISNSTNDLNVV